MRPRTLLALAPLPAALLLQWAAARTPATVERVFARGVYASAGSRLSCLTAPLPFSLAEGVVAAAALVLLWRGGPLLLRVARGRQDWRGPLLAALFGAGVLELAFLLCWGLNYQRQPFARSAGLDVSPPSRDELVAAAAALVAEADAWREGLPEDAAGALSLPGGTEAALARAAEGFARAAAEHPVLAGSCGRPKPVMASLLLSYLGLGGIYFPFTGEPNVNVLQPAAEIPFSAAHELAHQRGFAREDEANYLGALACRRHPDAVFRYSGALAASRHLLGALRALDAGAERRIAARRSPAVRRDLAAIAAWLERYRGPALGLSERVNDAYLKAQGQREGVRSYGRMVDLLVAERRPRR